MENNMIGEGFTVGSKILENENKCCICGTRKNLEPHHIVYTTKYDELYNSMDNVVVMCHNCHHEYHQRYNYQLGFKTLLKFKDDYWKGQCPNLKKENKILRKTIKKLEDVLEMKNRD